MGSTPDTKYSWRLRRSRAAVVLQTLAPAERLAFVLHDMFAVPFDEIAPIVSRSAPTTRQLASRVRRRVHGAAPLPVGGAGAADGGGHHGIVTGHSRYAPGDRSGRVPVPAKITQCAETGRWGG